MVQGRVTVKRVVWEQGREGEMPPCSRFYFTPRRSPVTLAASQGLLFRCGKKPLTVLGCVDIVADKLPDVWRVFRLMF